MRAGSRSSANRKLGFSHINACRSYRNNPSPQSSPFAKGRGGRPSPLRRHGNAKGGHARAHQQGLSNRESAHGKPFLSSSIEERMKGEESKSEERRVGKEC